jgi:hypothetical protein
VKKVRIFNITDIHLGHNNTPTKTIVNNIYTYFKDNVKFLLSADIVTISGDYFHKLLSSVSDDYKLGIECLLFIAKFCDKHGIILRVLEGTPSHDVNQLATFSKTLEAFQITLDFKYIDILTVEYMEAFDMHILYVPDEVSTNAVETQDKIRDMMGNMSLTKVDHIVMHGQFHYHLPIFSQHSFDEDFFLGITDNYIVNGHIHIFSTFNRIITPGSFDRLTHNEEGKKGGIFISYDGYGGKEYIFIENKHAMSYVTLRYKHTEPDIIVKDIMSLRLRDGSHVRVLTEATSDRSIRSTLKTMFPNYTIKVETRKAEEETSLTDTLTLTFKELHITRDNIMSLVKSRLGDKFETVEADLCKFI